MSSAERLSQFSLFYPITVSYHYADGEVSMGFHSDDTAKLADDTGIAILSLGAARDIVFRNKIDRAIVITHALAKGCGL